MDTNYIYLVFSKTPTWLSRLIGLVTGSNFTHVSISFDNKFDNLYSFCRKYPNNPFYGGFAIESLHKGVYAKSPLSYCLIYKIPVSGTSLKIIKDEVNKFVINADMYKYNFLGLFMVLLNKPFERKNYYFCSQFVTMLLNKSNVWNSPKHITLTKPIDLLKIENKEIIFEGYVYELQYNSIEKRIMV